MSMTRREYAISKGLARPTRGRMSREAHEAIEAAIKAGMTFTDSSPAPKTPKVVKDDAPVSDEPVKVEKPKVDARTYFGPTPERRRDRMADAYETADGVRKSYRDCCAVCSMSIGWCSCAVAMHITVDGSLVPLSPVLTRSR